METKSENDAPARERETHNTKLQAVGELARRLPDAHKIVDKLHATWKALVSRTTPAWEKALVALEAVRLAWEARRTKPEEQSGVTRPE
jgi:hypothetical protein